MSLMSDAEALKKDFEALDKKPAKKLNESTPVVKKMGKTISRKKLVERMRIKEQTLKFTDGVEIDVSGKMRTEKYKDGWYVVGDGKLIPVKSQKEGEDIISGYYMNESTIYKNLRRQRLKGSVASRIKNRSRT